MKKFVIATFVGTLMAAGLSAQEFHHFSFDAGAGFTQGLGATGRVTDMGWNVRGGVGYNFSPHFGVGLNLGYDNLGINSSTLATVGVPGGRMSVFSATIDPIVHFHPE